MVSGRLVGHSAGVGVDAMFYKQELIARFSIFGI